MTDKQFELIRGKLTSLFRAMIDLQKRVVAIERLISQADIKEDDEVARQ